MKNTGLNAQISSKRVNTARGKGEGLNTLVAEREPGKTFGDCVFAFSISPYSNSINQSINHEQLSS